jgi:CO/xanthine dehydrogenase Mo-binding subunit
VNKRGVGMATFHYGIGNTGKPNPSSAFVEVLEDAGVLVLCGASDMGQGSSTTLAQIVATELGVSIDRVTVHTADTLFTPEAGVSSGTRQTYVSGNACLLAARQAKETILAAAAEAFFPSRTMDDLELRGGHVMVSACEAESRPIAEVVGWCRARGQLIVGSGAFNPQNGALDEETGQGEPYGAYAFGTQVAEVDVDTETGEVTVLRVTAAHDLGAAVNPTSAQGQIQGGVAMGLGYATMEEVLTEEGRVTTASFAEYMIPTALDVPPIEAVLVEDLESTGPFGAKGIGEPPACPTAAAVANAVYDAIGIRVMELPLSAERVYLALQAGGKRATTAGGDPRS